MGSARPANDAFIDAYSVSLHLVSDEVQPVHAMAQLDMVDPRRQVVAILVRTLIKVEVVWLRLGGYVRRKCAAAAIVTLRLL